MANFYDDTPDIAFLLRHTDLSKAVEMQECGYTQCNEYSEAPTDYDDAIENYELVLRMIGELSANSIAPRAEDIDREGNRFDLGCVTRPPGMQQNLDELARADVMGMTLPRRFGGLNFPTTIYTAAIEMVSRADAALMNIFGLQGIAETINAFASEEIKQKYLPGFCSGKYTGAMALTEPDAGSDLQNVQLKATEQPDGTWLLNGVKRFITNGCGEVLLTMARSEDETGGLGLSLFVHGQHPNLKVRRIEDKLGIHGSPTCELQFNDVPAELVGERRRGLVTYVMALMNGARLGIAAQSLGIGQAAFVEARRYARSRQQFGKSIEEFPAVADLLVEMEIDIEVARALTYRTSYIVDLLNNYTWLAESDDTEAEAKKAARKEAKSLKRLAAFLTPVCKYYATEMCNRVAYHPPPRGAGAASQRRHPPRREYPLERYYRDARITNIYEGTTQLQIVAAIGGVVSGVAERYFEQLASREMPEGFDEEVAMLAEARQTLKDCVAFTKEKGDQGYTDLMARRLVDMAIDIFTGYLFLDQARFSERKGLIARRLIRRAKPKTDMQAQIVKSGDTSSIANFGEIAMEPVEVA